MPNFRRHFIANYRLERSLYVKLKDWISNSKDPGETAHDEPSHLDLCSLEKPIIIACGSEIVKFFMSRQPKSGNEIFYAMKPCGVFS